MLELHWWSSRTCLFYRFLARPSLTAISSLLSQYFASVSVWAIVLSWPAAGHPAWPDYCYIPGWPPVDHHQCHVSSPAKMDYNNNLNSDNKTILWTTKSETISAFSLQPGTVIAVSYNFTKKIFEWKFTYFISWKLQEFIGNDNHHNWTLASFNSFVSVQKIGIVEII